jgi:hypothetical protein
MSDDYIARHGPGPRFEVAPSVLAARESVGAAGRDLVDIRDDELERTWGWRDHEVDVRYGLYRPIEAVEAATAEVAAVLASNGVTRGDAALRISPATVARWSLHGRLMALDDGWLDRVPKEGEWTLRQTIGHIVGSQRGYAVFTTWYWLRNSTEPVSDEERHALETEASLPEDDEEGEGSLADIRRRLDETTDRSATLAGWTTDDIARPARWSGIPVDIAFRLGRTSSHVMEHSIQVDKTLAWLEHRPTEAQRIVRDLHSAWGRLEATIFPMEAKTLALRDASGRSVDTLLASLGDGLVADARSARSAAGA